ncbi:NACHT domain-containing NTPase [Streptomyces sp. RM99]|uniref:NACHT domain-containing protein n=1 Tax=Streptomyces sp. RM99 TaxID=2824897 RepID=UPI001B39002F|nr:NACHT domain-containing protein [Streptomyces sp. RM99]MBQ0916688.1 NACHT domain-containing protein [Streptomyces sp. RM99]
MEPAVLGGKLASSLVAPLVKKLFVTGGPGAGLVDRPVRLTRLVSFRGEQRHLGEAEVGRLAGRLVGASLDSPGEPPFPPDETEAVTHALTARLLALGDLDMDDVQAVRLGHRELAAHLRRRTPSATGGLSADACHFLDSVTEWACLHILEFFTRRSTFVARTLVAQTRGQAELIAKVDELIARTPRPDARDTAFERRYLPYVAERHNHLTIYGLDLRDSPDRWPLEVAYLSLEATAVPNGAGTDGPWFTVPYEGQNGTGTGAGTIAHIPAEEALSGRDRVLLRGDAGSGKTTLVQWLAVTAARDGDRIPYVLPLRTLVRAGLLPSPAAFLTAVGCPLTPPEGWAERVLTAGRGLLLVDGLDEVPADERQRVRDWLLGLITAFPGNRWLLTSRPSAVRLSWLDDEGFGELSLAPMRQREVATFVHRWHTAARASQFEGSLLDSLRTKRDLARLATNPLMCGLICALHRERRGYLPTGRKELYDAALAMLLARRDRERGLPGEAFDASTGTALGEEALLEVLQRLAYALVLSGRTEMGQDTARGIVERCLPAILPSSAPSDADAVLRILLLRTGLLRQPTPGIIEFVHRTFQDYLGARYAVEEGHLDVVTAHVGDSQWDDVVRMTVAHARPRERAILLRRLLAEDSPRAVLLALASLEHVGALDPSVRAEVEERAARLIPPETTAAAKDLATAGPLVLELLPGPEGLTDEQARCVTVTASILGKEEPIAALGILRRFRDHPHIDVRRQLSGTWSRFDGEEYATEVLDHLDRRGLFVVCETEAQCDALGGMEPWLRVAFRGPLSVGRIVEALGDRETVDTLSLEHNPELRDLDGLRALRHLRELWIIECPKVRNLGSLAPLALQDLAVFSPIADLDGLVELTSLTNLSLGHPVPGTALTAALPDAAPLSYLYLGHAATTHTGLRGLSHWRHLSALCLDNLSAPLTAADWREVTELPSLRRLFLRWPEPTALGEVPELTTVEELRIPPWQDETELRALADRFPALRSVVVNTKEPTMPADAYALYASAFPGTDIINGGL